MATETDRDHDTDTTLTDLHADIRKIKDELKSIHNAISKLKDEAMSRRFKVKALERQNAEIGAERDEWQRKAEGRPAPGSDMISRRLQRKVD